MKDSLLSRGELVGLLAGIAPFFVSCSSSSTRTVNGRVVESSYFAPAIPGASRHEHFAIY
jgi:hypothetical protein